MLNEICQEIVQKEEEYTAATFREDFIYNWKNSTCGSRRKGEIGWKDKLFYFWNQRPLKMF